MPVALRKILSNLRFQSPPIFKFQPVFYRDVLFLITLGLIVFYYLALFSFSPFDNAIYSKTFPEIAIKNLGGKTGAYLSSVCIYVFGLSAYLIPTPFLISALLILLKRQKALAVSSYFGWSLAIFTVCYFSTILTPFYSYLGISFPSGGNVGIAVTKSFHKIFSQAGSLVLNITAFLIALILISQKELLVPSFKILKNLLVKIYPRRLGKTFFEDLSSLPNSEQEQHLWPALDVISPHDESKLISAKQFSEPLPEMRKFSSGKSSYTPPPSSIFKSTHYKTGFDDNKKQEYEQYAKIIESTFIDFGVSGKVIAIKPGPVVTVFEYEPDAGTKLAKLMSLIDDLALALKVDSIFIHPVSGKRAVGIQVPNTLREQVFLGDLVKSEHFTKELSPLTFAMGKSLNGEPVCADLTLMPHLLMAGATGAGKSVAINALLCSIIMKSSPEDVRMILVDPKMLELSVYEGIPHLLMPVITEPIKASLALKWATREMERRYKLMQHVSVRHISSFNEFWLKASDEKRQELCQLMNDHKISKLPFILLVIDELADLMLTAPKDVESSIQRLAQKARACGIHLVLATQRPSVDIITGVIKANLPCRVAFQVVSKHDSRTILDQLGAEKLLGKGDLLFQRPGINRLERIQGAFISDDEVVNLVNSVKQLHIEQYDHDLISWIEDEATKPLDGSDDFNDIGIDADQDPKFAEAMQIAQTHGAISASYLQRQLKIGYNRAARIVESMETKGFLSTQDGAKPRRWLGPSLG